MLQLLKYFSLALIPPAPLVTKSAIPIAAKAKIQEWRDATFDNTSSKYAADRRIKTMEKQFLKDHPDHSYEIDLYRQYDSIFKLATDEDVSNGAAENRACHNGLPRLHRLQCGHIVFSEQISACGSSCVEPQVDVTRFFCLLCTQHSLQTMPLKSSDR